jgi:polyferredoxin
MKRPPLTIVHARRASQVVFGLLFLWLLIVATFGDAFWRASSWPIRWFLELDPLIALVTTLATGVLYAGLAWALLTVALTLLLGRVFCGWVCPLGTLNQLMGWLGKRLIPKRERLALNRPHRLQGLKHYLLFFFLSGAALGLVSEVSTLQIGLLDPIALLTRGVGLVFLPLADALPGLIFSAPRSTLGAFAVGGFLLAVLLANLWIPRFYCRFLCPLGALLGLLGRHALWRPGRRIEACTDCGLCERDCEGACAPSATIQRADCVLCMNCLDACGDGAITFASHTPSGGEQAWPSLTRRGFVASIASGVAAAPLLVLEGTRGAAASPGLVRPPGALPEADLLARCVKCGECMRVCPTNVLQPAGLEHGLEALWTPTLAPRIGTSGCQPNCVACGHACPTAAIRPLSFDERLGRGAFEEDGPVRMGLAFVDRGRCLPWAMDVPCVVCEENCPVSPKAITLRTEHRTLVDGVWRAREVGEGWIALNGAAFTPGRFASGDYWLAYGPAGDPPRRLRIKGNAPDVIELAGGFPASARPAPGDEVRLQVRLQLPQVDPKRCTGCGICQHECPVRGKRAIRVSAENETRSGRPLVL